VVAPWLVEANGDIAHLLSGTPDAAGTLAFFERWFERPGHRLSFEQALVLEADGAPRGALVAYHGRDAGRLEAPLGARLRHPLPTEARADEFYLDSLAVAPGARGRGFGRALLAAFEAEAARRGHRVLSMLAEPENAVAYGLYRRRGFEPDGEFQAGGARLERLVKRV
jgi:ribosomal protein S18 acetylase RimI-like enzyme